MVIKKTVEIIPQHSSSAPLSECEMIDETIIYIEKIAAISNCLIHAQLCLSIFSVLHLYYRLCNIKRCRMAPAPLRHVIT